MIKLLINSDWRKNEETFENWNHDAWREKAAHIERARQLSNRQVIETGDGMKVVAVFVGLFLETSIHVCLDWTINDWIIIADYVLSINIAYM